MDLIARFDEVCFGFGDDTALLPDDVCFTELNSWSQDVAGQLYSRFGVRPGDVVLVCPTSSSHAMEIVSLLACLRVGALWCPCPCDLSDPDHRLSYVLNDCHPSAAIVVGKDDRSPAAKALNEVGLYKVVLLNRDGSLVYEEAMMCVPPTPRPPLSRKIYVQYTSGTTGSAKGIIGTMDGLMNRINWQQESFPFERSGELTLRRTPLTFIDSIAEIFVSLLAHVPMFCPSTALDIVTAVNEAKANRVSRLQLIPSQLLLVMQHVEYWSELRFVFISGEPVFGKLVEIFRAWTSSKCRLVSTYGSTECAGDVCFIELTKFTIPCDLMPIGSAINKNVSVSIENEEIVVGGVAVAAGYWNGATFSSSFRTGDLGFAKDGVLYWKGRKDLQVKVRGIRIELEQVELEIGNIIGGRVLCLHSAEFGLVACVENREDLSQIMTQITRNLIDSHVPHRVFSLPEFYKSSTGKLDRPRMNKMVVDGLLKQSKETESALRHGESILLKVLGLITVDESQTFRELGGDSMKAIQFSWELCGSGNIVAALLSDDPIAKVLDWEVVTSLASRKPEKKRRISQRENSNESLTECIWSYQMERCVDATPVLFNSKVFIASHGNDLVCLQVDSGEVGWHVALPGVCNSSCLIVSECLVVVTSNVGNEGHCLLMNSKTSDRVASHIYKEGIFSSKQPLLWSNRVVLGTSDETLLVLDAVELKECFKVDMDGVVMGKGGVCKDGVVVGTTNGCLSFVALKNDCGETKWTTQVGPIYGDCVISDLLILVGSVDCNLYGVNVESGSIAWKYCCKGCVFSTPLVSTGGLYFGCHDMNVRKLSTSDGSSIWEAQVDAAVVTKPAIVGNDSVVVATTSGSVFILSLSDGTLVKKISLPAEIFSSPIAACDKSFIVGCRNDKVYRLEMGKV